MTNLIQEHFILALGHPYLPVVGLRQTVSKKREKLRPFTFIVRRKQFNELLKLPLDSIQSGRL
ncbi:MAG TPA: hypothetical protein VIL61_00060 [Nitrospiria bacterium]